MEKIVWEIPLKTVSEANSSEHWSVSSKRHRQQQFFVRSLFHGLKQEITLPCTITLTRLNSRALDDDNLVSAFKHLRDEIALCIFPEKRKCCLLKNGNTRRIKGVGDSDQRLNWRYGQQKSTFQGIRIEIFPYEMEKVALEYWDLYEILSELHCNINNDDTQTLHDFCQLKFNKYQKTNTTLNHSQTSQS